MDVLSFGRVPEANSRQATQQQVKLGSPELTQSTNTDRQNFSEEEKCFVVSGRRVRDGQNRPVGRRSWRTIRNGKKRPGGAFGPSGTLLLLCRRIADIIATLSRCAGGDGGDASCSCGASRRTTRPLCGGSVFWCLLPPPNAPCPLSTTSVQLVLLVGVSPCPLWYGPSFPLF